MKRLSPKKFEDFLAEEHDIDEVVREMGKIVLYIYKKIDELEEEIDRRIEGKKDKIRVLERAHIKEL